MLPLCLAYRHYQQQSYLNIEGSLDAKLLKFFYGGQSPALKAFISYMCQQGFSGQHYHFNRNTEKPSSTTSQIRTLVSLLSLLITRCCTCPLTHSKASISTSRPLLYMGLCNLCILSLHSFIFSFIDP